MPKTWNLKIDNYFHANPRCIIATAHVDGFPIDLPLEPNISSKVNARGDYKFIQQYLNQLEREQDRKFRIAYYQNQSGVPKNAQCNINHLLKLLNCLDRNRYNPDGKTRSKHPSVSNSPSQISDAEQERFTLLLPLLPKAMWIEQRLYEIVQEHISNPRRKGANDLASIDSRKNTLLADSKYSFGFGAPAGLSLPIVAAYRVFLDEKYQWIIPFDEFAESFLQHLWSNYYRKYLISEKTAGSTVGSKIVRNPDIWESLYISAQSYLNQHLMKMVNSKRENLVLTSG